MPALTPPASAASPVDPPHLIPDGGAPPDPGTPPELGPSLPSPVPATPPSVAPSIPPAVPPGAQWSSEEQAEAGTSSSTLMSPLRTKQAFRSFRGSSEIASGAVTLVDEGRTIFADGDLTIASGIFSEGDSIAISNTTASAINVTSAVPIRVAGTTDLGNIQIAGYGFVTILFEGDGAKAIGTGIALAIDADAEAFLTAASITDADVGSAVSSLVSTLKAESLWSKFLGIYPMVQNPGGSSTTPHTFNLKNPTQQMEIIGSVIASDNGLKGDGGYADLGINLNTTTPNSLAFGFYSRSASEPAVAMAAHNGSSDGVLIFPRYGGDNNAYFDNQYNGGAGRCGAVVSDSLGFYVSSRTASNSAKGYKRGSPIAVTTGAQGTLVNANFLLWRRSIGDVSGYADLSFACVSDGLTDSDNTKLNAAVQAFQEALGRAV